MIAAVVLLAIVIVALTLVGTVALMWRAQRDDAEAHLRELYDHGRVVTLPPRAVRYGTEPRVDTHSDTMLTPEPRASAWVEVEDNGDRDTLPSASTVREIR